MAVTNELSRGIYRRSGVPETNIRLSVEQSIPGPAALLQARQIVAAHLQPTPFEFSAALSARFGRSIWLKFENTQPIRSFKIRGALTCVSRMSSERRQRGIVTASTGNHGQGLSFAGQVYGVPVTVVVPVDVDPVKKRVLVELGANLVVQGANFTEAAAAARRLALECNLTCVEDGADAALMAGAATIVWEMLEAQPDLDVVLVPVGGGNLLASSLLAAQRLRPDLKVIGVQSSAAPGATMSWLDAGLRSAPCRTSAGGLATEQPGGLALLVMLQLLTAMVLVSEEDIWRAVAIGFRSTGYAIEPAGAAGIAALEAFGAELEGGTCGIIITGGRIGAEDLMRALAGAEPS